MSEDVLSKAHDLMCDTVIVINKLSEGLPVMEQLACKQIVSEMDSVIRNLNNRMHEPDGEYA